MKLNNDVVNGFEVLTVSADCAARVESREGFKKMMVFYRHGNPVWAHKDCYAVEQIPQKKRKRT
jgi:hypothetical protein